MGSPRLCELAGAPDPHTGTGVGPGAPPILVVGTTGDPVTPYKWAVSLAGELSGGVLLTWQGQSHVAYFYSSCVRRRLRVLPGDGRAAASRDHLSRLRRQSGMMGGMADEATARQEMVSRLRRAGIIADPHVEAAMLEVPRHRFVPHIGRRAAYLDEAVMVKHARNGVPISSLSQPTIVATMLERLRVVPGHHVLEVGTGTGYNAALLSVLAGPEGYVASIELEPDLAAAAARTLADTGYRRVDVLVGDGRNGYAPGAPFDRVIVTTGARAVAQAWVGQLAAGGRLVVPLVDHRGVGLIVVFAEVGGELIHTTDAPCGFIPLRNVPSFR